MLIENRRTLVKAFIKLQPSYRPLIGMLHSGTLNNKTNRICKRALKTVSADHKSSFNELLDNKDGFFTIHKKIFKLAIAIFKYLHSRHINISNKIR